MTNAAAPQGEKLSFWTSWPAVGVGGVRGEEYERQYTGTASSNRWMSNWFSDWSSLGDIIGGYFKRVDENMGDCHSMCYGLC